MKMLQESDFAKVKFKEEKLPIQEGVLEGQYSFASLLSFLNNSKTQDKASWILSGVVENQPEIINADEIGFLLKLLEKGVPITVERNIWRVFQFVEVPKKHHEKCLYLAFETLENKESSIAVQVFAMSMAFELSKTNNDLKPY